MFQKYSVASSKVIFIREPGALILILVNALSLSVKHIMASLASCTNEKVTSTTMSAVHDS